MNRGHVVLAIVFSHLEAIYTRLDYLVRRVFSPAAHRLNTRGEVCPLCAHQLGAPEQRPPRDTRTTKGKLKRLPAEILTWRRCGGCGLHQVGEAA